MRANLLTIDFGGTMTKVLLYDEQGKLHKESHFETKKLEPQLGYAEVDLKKTWTLLCDAIRKVMIGVDNIDAITTVGHGKGLYLWGENNLEYGILSVDRRGGTVFQDVQIPSLFASSAPILLSWMKQHQPHLYTSIRHVMSAKDWIGFMLSGEASTDVSDASSNGWLDMETTTYRKDILQALQIEDILPYLPEVFPSHHVRGKILDEVADQLGIPKNTPIISGMFDVDACALASQVVDDQYMSMTAGTWSVNAYISTTRVQTSELLISCFVNGKDYVIESSSPTSAGNLKIMLKALFPEEMKQADVYGWIESHIQSMDLHETNLLFFPFLYGTQSTVIKEAQFFGINSQVTNFMLIRSVYEGIVFAHRYHAEQLYKARGKKMKVRLSGGAVHSVFWVQMFADILGVDVEVCDTKEMGGLGGAMMNAYAIGIYSTIVEAAKHMTNIAYVKKPNRKRHEKYERRYQKYRQMVEGERYAS